MFTPINSELRNFSSDKMTLNFLIIKYLKCHLSFVIFAFTLRMQQFTSCLWGEILRDGMCTIFEKSCMVLSDFDVDKGMIKWVTLLGRVFKIRDFLCMNLSDFVVVDR